MVLISSVLDMGTLSFSPGDDRSYIFYIPTYAAAAWYYTILKDRPDDLNAFLDDARRFASTEYAAALMKGSKLSSTEATDIAQKLAGFTGLSEDYLLKAHLRVVLLPVSGRTPKDPRSYDRTLRCPATWGKPTIF